MDNFNLLREHFKAAQGAGAVVVQENIFKETNTLRSMLSSRSCLLNKLDFNLIFDILTKLSQFWLSNPTGPSDLKSDGKFVFPIPSNLKSDVEIMY